MTKTLLLTVLSISLISLSACQTARIQSASSTDSIPERSIAQAPVEGALEAVIKNLGTNVAADNADAFNANVLRIINSHKADLGVVSKVDVTLETLDASVADPQAFLNNLAKSKLLSGLNVKKGDLQKALSQQTENLNASTHIATSMTSVSDLVKSTDPVTADSFKAAISAGADRADATAIVADEQAIENAVHIKVAGGGCDHLQNKDAITALRKIMDETKDAAVNNSIHSPDDAVVVVQKGIAEQTQSDTVGAKDRFCELADPKKCAVFVLPTTVCEEYAKSED
jgi:hypothetical protein